LAATIDLYTHATPNGHKISIMLEEVGLPYRIHLVDLQKGEQFKPDFVALNPNSKIPAIVDPDGPDGKPITVFESGAILFYLARKTGSALLPADLRGASAVMEWLMFQVANVGPMFGQVGHFTLYSQAPEEKRAYGIERYTKEAHRLLAVMDARLKTSAYLAGPDYSIADIATYPWTNSALRLPTVGDLAPYPHVVRWRESVGARPAVQRGLDNPKRS
jgi:GST-like protein